MTRGLSIYADMWPRSITRAVLRPRLLQPRGDGARHSPGGARHPTVAKQDAPPPRPLVRCSVSRCALAHGLICRFVDVSALRERSIGDEHIAFDIAKPLQCELVCGARHCDRTVRTPTALIGGALGDDLDEEDIGFRRSNASKFADATKIRIFRFCVLGCDCKLDVVWASTTDLGELSTPLAGNGRTNRGHRIVACGRAGN